jgi:hypothetical protein
MWETAERAGMITANLMWYAIWQHLCRHQPMSMSQARSADNLLGRIIDVLRAMEKQD